MMPTTALAAAPTFETRDPGLVLSGGRLAIQLPIINSGAAVATRVTVTAVTLGSATRLEPALPLVIGDLVPPNGTVFTTFFSGAGMIAGSRFVLTVRGTYRNGAQTAGFTLNRVITVPAETPPAFPVLAARLVSDVDSTNRTWSYVAVNEEPAGSPLYLNAVSIDMVTPFTVTGTPAGWAVDTDNLTYVFWYATDTALPYASHVAPGNSLAGFQVHPSSNATPSEGRAFSITSWNHTTDSIDLVAFGTTLVPARS